MTAVAGTNLLITAGRASDEDWPPYDPITIYVGEEFTWVGGAQSRTGIRADYADDCPDATEAITAAWQISLTDPQWGRYDILWPALTRFAATL
jgi:hypothetical protein